MWAAGDLGVVARITASSASPTCRSAPPATSRAASPERTPSAAPAPSRGSVGTQVVKVFDLVAARTGLRHDEAENAGYAPSTTAAAADDHKRYYPGARTRSTSGSLATPAMGGCSARSSSGRRGTEVAKRVDTYATALYAGLTINQLSDLDLSYTPRSAPRGTPCKSRKPGMPPRGRRGPRLILPRIHGSRYR